MALQPLKERNNNEHVPYEKMIKCHVFFTTKSMCVKASGISLTQWYGQRVGIVSKEECIMSIFWHVECRVAPLWVEVDLMILRIMCV